MFTPDGFDPETSARWLIDEIAKEASLQGTLLSDWDIRVLSSTVLDFEDNQRHLVEASHNLAVQLARSAMDRAKEDGVETLEVRDGLVIPQIWEDHYETVYESEFPWIVSLVMQNAFLGNPFIGETETWNSPALKPSNSIRVSPNAPATAQSSPGPKPIPVETKSDSELPLELRNHVATPALVLGIASVFLFPTVFIPMGSIVVGGIALGRASELKAKGVTKRGFGFSLTGLILGILYLFVGIIGV